MNINTFEILNGLRSLADELKPFTLEVRNGSRVWNGTAYRDADPRRADPYALAWWSTLTSIADMIEYQNAPLTSKQIDYLKRRIFGGMGSFSDFSLDADLFGNAAELANQKLADRRTALYRCFQSSQK